MGTVHTTRGGESRREREENENLIHRYAGIHEGFLAPIAVLLMFQPLDNPSRNVGQVQAPRTEKICSSWKPELASLLASARFLSQGLEIIATVTTSSKAISRGRGNRGLTFWSQ